MKIALPVRVKSRALGPASPTTVKKTDAAQRIVQRSAATGQRNVIDLYLRAFGVKDLTLRTIPECVNPDFKAEWRAFINANKELRGKPAGRALRAVLSFLMYCRELRIDPLNQFFVYRDPLGKNSKIDTNAIRRAVVDYEMQQVARQVTMLSVRNKLPLYFKIVKSKSETGSIKGVPVLVCNYVLAPKSNRMHLDAILPIMEGSLYTGDLPPQLKKVTQYGKDAGLDAAQLMKQSTFGWYVMYQTDFGLYLKRARNGQLVMRVVIDLNYLSEDNGDLPRRDYLRAWNKTKKPF